MKTDLIRQGLTGLARAGEIGWFPGHFGAAVLTSHFLRERTDLSTEIKAKIERNALDIIEENPRFFVPFEEEAPVSRAEEKILELIRPNLKSLVLSGHGVIYGSLALKALRVRPELATPALIERLDNLLAHTRKDRGVRYYGTEDYRAVKEVDVAPYRSLVDLIRQTFRETAIVYPDQLVEDAYYYFSSEKLHTFTYAQALSDLVDLGYEDIAKSGFDAHRFQVGLSRQVPPTGEPKRFSAEAGETFSPYLAAYWDRDHFDDHALKFAYAVLALNDKVPTVREPDFWLKFAR